MLVVKEALSAQALVCLQKLKALDLAAVARHLMNPSNGDGWTRQQALRAIRRYKTFLFVSYLYPPIVLIPTQEIDRVWHCHILHTCKYRQDCEMLFGYFIDHEPESAVSSETHQQNLDAAFAQTQALLALWEGYFEADSQETELPTLKELELTECQLQFGYEGGKGDLHFQHSACGRPKIENRYT
jgi:hypothetical protein